MTTEISDSMGLKIHLELVVTLVPRHHQNYLLQGGLVLLKVTVIECLQVTIKTPETPRAHMDRTLSLYNAQSRQCRSNQLISCVDDLTEHRKHCTFIQRTTNTPTASLLYPFELLPGNCVTIKLKG